MQARSEHWTKVYSSKAETEVSWYQASPEPSLSLIRSYVPPTSSVIDIGAGASFLADELLAGGYRDLTLLDIAEPALSKVRVRLGARSENVSFVVADITTWTPGRTWDVWHDRAVFHFLTELPDQEAYIAALKAATESGSCVIISCFAPDGPERCSGLAVQRYSAETLAERLGSEFGLVASQRSAHTTPAGGTQAFTYAVFRRR